MTIFKVGFYSNRLDQEGLDSPPFAEVSDLWLSPLAFMMKILDPPSRFELKAM
jgi:hypothetical protein